MEERSLKISLAEAARRVGARVAVNAQRADAVEVAEFRHANRISDLLNAAGEGVLLVTELANPQLARVAELMDLPGICLVNNAEPGPALTASLERIGTVLLIAPTGVAETLALLQNGTRSPTERT
jgi:hypothetical protein